MPCGEACCELLYPITLQKRNYRQIGCILERPNVLQVWGWRCRVGGGIIGVSTKAPARTDERGGTQLRRSTSMNWSTCTARVSHQQTASPALQALLDAGCSYGCLSVSHTSEYCKNDWTDRDAVGRDGGGGRTDWHLPKEPWVKWVDNGC